MVVPGLMALAATFSFLFAGVTTPLLYVAIALGVGSIALALVNWRAQKGSADPHRR